MLVTFKTQQFSANHNLNHMKSIQRFLPFLLFTIVVLNGCFGPHSGSMSDFKRPIKHDFERKSIINSGYDKVWSNLVSWFSESNTSLKLLEKESGYIKTEFAQIRGDSADCDCGVVPYGYERNGNGIMGEITINVQQIDNQHTSVTITITYICDIIDSFEPWVGNKMKTVDFNGESTGGLERRIIQAISK